MRTLGFMGSAATSRLFSSGTQNLSRDLVAPTAAATVAARAPSAALTAPAKVIAPAPAVAKPILATPAALAPVERIVPTAASPTITAPSHPAEEGVTQAVQAFSPFIAAAAPTQAAKDSPPSGGGLRVLPGLANLFGGGADASTPAASSASDDGGAFSSYGGGGSAPSRSGGERSSVGASFEAPDFVWIAALGVSVVAGGLLLWKKSKRGRR